MNTENDTENSDNCQLAAKVLDNMNTCIMLLSKDLHVLCMNSAAEMLFQVSARKILGKSIRLLISDSQLIKALENTFKNVHPFTKREQPLQILSKKHIVDIGITPILSDHKKKELIIEINQLDRHMKISKEGTMISQNQTARAVIRGMAHEVKNPLGGIRGAAQLLERELDKPELTEYTEVIIAEADRLTRLVNRMLGPSSLPKKEKTNLHRVTERIRNLVTADKNYNISMNFDYDPSIPELDIDPEQLIQALLNIVQNASQALTENTRQDSIHEITIRTRIQRHFTIGNTFHKLIAKIEIIDNGPGIPEEILETIFMPLITGRAEGTGLGLSIAQSLVNQNGGLIECDSHPGKTVFTLLLPIGNQS